VSPLRLYLVLLVILASKSRFHDIEMQPSFFFPLLFFCLSSQSGSSNGATQKPASARRLDKVILQAQGALPYFHHSHPDAHLLNSTLPRIPVDDVLEKHYEYQDYERTRKPFRTIAFYFPQYHPFKENDKFWGKGFTEWTNVAKAKPLFASHYQPRLPTHLGYYDLRITENMVEQAKIAQNYGVDAFAYHFYWFAGRTVMETPLENMLKNKNVSINFCLSWANENWSRRWDGLNNDVLIQQEHSLEDSAAFLDHLLQYFRDERYIKVNGAPVLIVYRPLLIPDIVETVKMWRKNIKKAGFPGIYLVAAQSFGFTDPLAINFDAAVEFPPHSFGGTEISKKQDDLVSGFSGAIYSYYDALVRGEYAKVTPEEYPLFFTSTMGWDNTARMGDRGNVYHEFSLRLFKRWNIFNILRTLSDHRSSPDERLIFVNAWNEWAEGTYLEPDRKFGFGYLEALRQAQAKFHDPAGKFDSKILRQNDPRIHGTTKKHCMIIHAFSFAPTMVIVQRFRQLRLDTDLFDIYVTTDTIEKALAVKRELPTAIVSLHENRGRDIFPFLETLRSISHLPYASCLKLHSKETKYRADGAALRDKIINKLLPSKRDVLRVLKLFEKNPRLGAAAPATLALRFNMKSMHFDMEHTRALALRIGMDDKEFAASLKRPPGFVAGSMLWLRPAALESLFTLNSQDFPDEIGLSDGTMAHAVERMLLPAIEKAKFSMLPLPSQRFSGYRGRPT